MDTELAIASFCPLFVWIAARVRPAFTAVATFMCAITIVWTTIFAVGLFGDARLALEQRILSAQATFWPLRLARLFWRLCSASDEPMNSRSSKESIGWKKASGRRRDNL